MCLQGSIASSVSSYLTPSPPNKLLSANFLICFKIRSASMSLNVGEMLSESQTAWIGDRRRVTRRLTGSNLFAHWTTVVLGGLRANTELTIPLNIFI